jgi:hypothetical protein
LYLLATWWLQVIEPIGAMETSVFVASNLVVWQKVQPGYSGGLEEPCHWFRILFVIVDSGYDRHSHDHVPVFPHKRPQIPQNVFVAGARVCSVLPRVHQLQVIQKKIGLAADTQQSVARNNSARLYNRVNSTCPAGFKRCLQKKRLQKRFAAGKRHSATRLIEEDRVPVDLFHELLDGHPSSNHLGGTGGTDGYAASALLAGLRVTGGEIVPSYRTMRAGCDAIPAPDTTFHKIDHFRFRT